MHFLARMTVVGEYKSSQSYSGFLLFAGHAVVARHLISPMPLDKVSLVSLTDGLTD